MAEQIENVNQHAMTGLLYAVQGRLPSSFYHCGRLDQCVKVLLLKS